MKKLLSFFASLVVACTILAQNNVITYTASSILTEITSGSGGLHVEAFNVSISSHTFYSGTGTITFSGEVTTIGEWAFLDCSGLTSITIPNSVTTIGEWAFIECTAVRDIYCNATIPPTCEDADETFKAMGQFTTTVHVPAGSVDMYKVALGWRYFYNIVADNTALENVSSATDSKQKIIRDGQVIILQNGKAYDLLGRMVE